MFEYLRVKVQKSVYRSEEVQARTVFCAFKTKQSEQSISVNYTDTNEQKTSFLCTHSVTRIQSVLHRGGTAWAVGGNEPLKKVRRGLLRVWNRLALPDASHGHVFKVQTWSDGTECPRQQSHRAVLRDRKADSQRWTGTGMAHPWRLPEERRQGKINWYIKW